MHLAFSISRSQFLDDLDKAVADGLVRQFTDPTGKFVGYDYSFECQIDKIWTVVTKSCRGLILDCETREFAALPFSKFFNYGEAPESTIMPNLPHVVYPKWDGSLGIIWWDKYQEKWRVSTRGSFESEQAQWAQRFLDSQDINALNRDVTYLCEIIYPENKIVINYGDFAGLIMLTGYNVRTGEELSIDEVLSNNTFPHPWMGYKRGPYGPQATIEDLIKATEILPGNDEGYVVRFDNGLRIKIKGKEYLRLHRLKSNLTANGVWDILAAGIDPKSVLQNVPDEFYAEFNRFADEYLASFNQWKKDVLWTYDVTPKGTRKEFALAIKNCTASRRAALFSMLDNGGVYDASMDKIFWKGESC